MIPSSPIAVALDQQVNLLTCGTRFEGSLELETFSHFNGQIKGTLKSKPGSTLVIGDNGIVEGRIEADTIIIDGFVRGEIFATSKIIISETGRVVGTVHSPSFAIKFGGFFQGQCKMKDNGTPPPPEASL